MKKIIILVCVVVSMQTVFAQSDPTAIKLKTILAEKNEEIRVNKLYLYLSPLSNIDPTLTRPIAEKLLAMAEKNNDKIAEVYAISQLGNLYFFIGNNTKALEYALKTLKMAEPLNNATLLAIIKNRLALAYRSVDKSKQIEAYKQGLMLRHKAMQSKIFADIARNLGVAYTDIDKLDAALEYLQLADRINQKIRKDSSSNGVYGAFGALYLKMKNPALAYSYLNLDLKEALKEKSPRRIFSNYNYLATYFNELKQSDSAVFYQKKAIDAVINTVHSNYVIGPAKKLMNFYKNKNDVLAMQYADMYITATDNIASLNKAQQTYLMSFEEELRQKEITQLKLEANEQQKENLQYIFIAIGILTLIILFLLLSRSFITNTKLIDFFGVVGLLIIFEFLNLLLHPFLEKITHHNPILMLFSLVSIAALLVPLHHKVEHWAKSKLVEKNKEIRLANAKKTIKELDTQPEAKS